MTNYQVIDEPNPGPRAALVQNPLLILLASVLVPLFWDPPLFGRFWIPLLWLGANGALLGSPSLRKELLILIGTLVTLLVVFYGFTYLVFQPFWPFTPEAGAPYLIMALQGVLFSGLYWVVFLQSAPYQLFQYVRELQAP